MSAPLIFILKITTIDQNMNDNNKQINKQDVNQQKKSNARRKKTLIRPIFFFFFDVKIIFIELKQTFIVTYIIYYFDAKYYVKIKIDVFGYPINQIFGQLTSNNLSQQHLVAFFFTKIIQQKPTTNS